MRERWIWLGWKILEHKYRYYLLDAPIISDYEYDQLDLEYRRLAEDLGEEPTASDMVGFDPSRWSSQEAMRKVDEQNYKHNGDKLNA